MGIQGWRRSYAIKPGTGPRRRRERATSGCVQGGMDHPTLRQGDDRRLDGDHVPL